MKILLCEDDKGIQELIELLLESDGYKVSVSASIKDAIELLACEKFKLIILDYWLEDGIADKLVEIIKSDYQETPTLLISAAGNLEELSTKLKVTDYLQKPFDIISFQSKVNTIINGNYDSSN